ncbi:hypothetical protein [Mycobacterium sp.]|uniref:hypothetical protein n=1 Tax=Mycobacterium sp. TaxID=1785 RepID=UPI003F98E442
MDRFTLWFFGIVGFAAQLAFMPAAHADPAPVRCKDLPGTFGNSHVCQYPDGSVISCITSPLPIVGPSCAPVYTQLVPGFWDQP